MCGTGVVPGLFHEVPELLLEPPVRGGVLLPAEQLIGKIVKPVDVRLGMVALPLIPEKVEKIHLGLFQIKKRGWGVGTRSNKVIVGGSNGVKKNHSEWGVIMWHGIFKFSIKSS